MDRGRALAQATARVADLPDSEIEELKERFGFHPGYQVGYLRSNIEQAAIFFFSYEPPATARQEKTRLERLSKAVDDLLRELGPNRVDFPDIEPIGIRRPLFALRDAARKRAAELAQHPPKRGRKRELGIQSWVLHLQHTYTQGTGSKDRYTWDEIEGRYRGGLVEFLESVASLCGIDEGVSNSSIGDTIKDLSAEGKLYDSARHRQG